MIAVNGLEDGSFSHHLALSLSLTLSLSPSICRVPLVFPLMAQLLVLMHFKHTAAATIGWKAHVLPLPFHPFLSRPDPLLYSCLLTCLIKQAGVKNLVYHSYMSVLLSETKLMLIIKRLCIFDLMSIYLKQISNPMSQLMRAKIFQHTAVLQIS